MAIQQRLLTLIPSGLALGLLLVSAHAGHTRTSRPEGPVAQGKPQPVVVELFTSEGCSTCPPADELLLRLRDTQPVPGAQVIAMEEHVDYWDHLGWIDPFSSSAWTARQEEYSRRFNNGGVYSPEMVVDGESGFVGSRESQAEHAIAAAAQTNKADMTLEMRANLPVLGVRINSIPWKQEESVDIFLAVTESNLQSNVDRGENHGRRLVHSGVLRSLKKVGHINCSGPPGLPLETSIDWKPNKGWKMQNLNAVVFLQDPKSLRILGAAETRP